MRPILVFLVVRFGPRAFARRVMRRATCSGFLAGLLWMVAPAVQGHDGPHMARVIADVLSVETEGRDVTIELRLEALQEPVTLVAATTGLAEPVATLPQTPVTLGEPVRQAVRLRFGAEVPDLFTLMLDFGEAGFGTVLVVTK